jgi:hypothetical protein
MSICRRVLAIMVIGLRPVMVARMAAGRTVGSVRRRLLMERNRRRRPRISNRRNSEREYNNKNCLSNKSRKQTQGFYRSKRRERRPNHSLPARNRRGESGCVGS